MTKEINNNLNKEKYVIKNTKDNFLKKITNENKINNSSKTQGLGSGAGGYGLYKYYLGRLL